MRYKLHSSITINKYKWCCSDLSSNPNAIEFLEQNMDILEMYPENIHWRWLAEYNRNSFHILKNNMERIHLNRYYSPILRNPEIFESFYDYPLIKKNMDILREDMMKKLFHPKNIDIFSGWVFEQNSSSEIDDNDTD